MKSKFWNKVFVFLLFLGILALTFWLYIRYKPVVTNPIPSNITSLVCLDVTNLRNTLLKEYFNSEEDESIFFNPREIGLKIPNYVLGFTMPNSPFVLHFPLEIGDIQRFKKWKDSVLVVPNKRDDFQIYRNRNTLYILNKNEDKLLVSLGFLLDENKSIEVAKKVFQKRELLDSDHPLISTIRKNREIGFIWIDKGKRNAKESMLFFDFSKGELTLNGDIFLNKEYRFDEMNNAFIASREQKAHFYFHGGNSKFYDELCNKVDRKKFENLINFSFDSLIHYADRSLNFSFYETKKVADTSVTYEYDENFNKVENVKVNQTIHPVFDLKVLENKQGLFDYLVSDSCIKQLGYKKVFTPYPFTKVYAYNDKGLVLSTAHLTQFLETKFPNFLELQINFSEIDTIFLKELGIKDSFIHNTLISLRGSQISDTSRIIGRMKFD